MTARAIFAAGVVALAALGAASCGSPPTPPPPLSGYQTLTGSSATIGTQGTVMVTASCPAGKVVIGGGYTTSNAAANIFDSFPTSNGNGWTVSVKNENVIGSSVTLAPIAVCVTTPAGYEVRSATTTLSSRERKSVSAGCTDLTLTLVGGGYRSGDSLVSNFSSSFDPSVVTASGVGAPTTWVSSFRSHHPIAASSSATSFAICVANGSVSAAYLASPTSTIGFGTMATLTTSCNASSPQTLVASAGVSANVSVAAIFDSMPATGSWSASVNNTSSALEQIAVSAMLLEICVSAV